MVLALNRAAAASLGVVSLNCLDVISGAMSPIVAAVYEGVNELERTSSRIFSLLRGGNVAPYKQMERYLRQGAAREVRTLCAKEV